MTPSCCTANFCSYDPRQYLGQPIGMYHCPECGEMVVAGLNHTEHSTDCAVFWARPDVQVELRGEVEEVTT